MRLEMPGNSFQKFEHLFERPRVYDIVLFRPTATRLRDAAFEVGEMCRRVGVGINGHLDARLNAFPDVFILEIRAVRESVDLEHRPGASWQTR